MKMKTVLTSERDVEKKKSMSTIVIMTFEEMMNMPLTQEEIQSIHKAAAKKQAK